jgi:hypothetical protein
VSANIERVTAVSASTKATIGGAEQAGPEARYKLYLQRFEAEATAFERGFKTALFIEQYRSGFLPNAGRKNHRLQ